MEITEDHGIVQKVKEGITADFEKIIRKYNTKLYRVGMSYLKDEHAVEDAMQNTYLKAFEGLDTFKMKASFSTWLVRIMINECLMILRKNKKFDHDAILIMEEESGEGNPLTSLEQAEIQKILEKAIIRLPQKYRAVYIFREIEQYSTEQTAELLDISESNVKIRLHRSKEMLRDMLLISFRKEELLQFYKPRCDKMAEAVMTASFQIKKQCLQ